MTHSLILQSSGRSRQSTPVPTAALGTSRGRQSCENLNQTSWPTFTTRARALRQIGFTAAFTVQKEVGTVTEHIPQYVRIVGIDNVTAQESTPVPNPFIEDRSSRHTTEWLEAATNNYKILVDLDVFDIISPDNMPCQSYIESSWVLHVKPDGDSK